VYFLGGGFLEVSGRRDTPLSPGLQLWVQVGDVRAVHEHLVQQGVGIVRPPRKEPWGLIEMWTADPDSVEICVVEVPEDHPLRHRS